MIEAYRRFREMARLVWQEVTIHDDGNEAIEERFSFEISSIMVSVFYLLLMAALVIAASCKVETERDPDPLHGWPVPIDARP